MELGSAVNIAIAFVLAGFVKGIIGFGLLLSGVYFSRASRDDQG